VELDTCALSPCQSRHSISSGAPASRVQASHRGPAVGLTRNGQRPPADYRRARTTRPRSTNAWAKLSTGRSCLELSFGHDRSMNPARRHRLRVMRAASLPYESSTSGVLQPGAQVSAIAATDEKMEFVRLNAIDNSQHLGKARPCATARRECARMEIQSACR